MSIPQPARPGRQIMKRNPDEIPITKQSETDATDINKLMAKYRNGGEIQHINRALARYDDFSSPQSFTDAMQAIGRASSAFAELPAHIRDRMDNDPEKFLYAMQEPAFQKEMSDLGVYDLEAGPILEPEEPRVETPPETPTPDPDPET